MKGDLAEKVTGKLFILESQQSTLKIYEVPLGEIHGKRPKHKSDGVEPS